MRTRAVVLAVTLVMAPLGARAADLVVWWQEGYYAQEDAAVRETVAAFEQEPGKQVEFVFYEQAELPEKIAAALEAGRRPTSRSARPCPTTSRNGPSTIGSWTSSDTVGHFSDLFDPAQPRPVVLLNARRAEGSLRRCPWGRSTNHVHVWKSLLEQAGFTLEDIPKGWDAFWSFWCDAGAAGRAPGYRPRRHLGRGSPMSAEAADTQEQLLQFMAAYDADYVTPDGRLVIDDPEVRRRR